MTPREALEILRIAVDYYDWDEDWTEDEREALLVLGELVATSEVKK